MFGKKKKKEQPIEVAPAREQELAQPTIDELVEETKIFLESELIEDDDIDLTQEYEAIAYILKQEQGEALHAEAVVDDEPAVEDAIAPAVVEEPAPAPAPQAPVEEPQEEVVEDVEEEEEIEEEVEEVEEVEETPAPAQEEEEVVYVVDGEDEEEHVKPAKLVKLPNLIDYMLMQNMSKRMKLNIATLLLSAYGKYKDIPEEKKIIIKCMAKVMQSLMQ